MSVLQPIVGDNLIALEHIGSTSVPGLAAKPIIDILLEVKSLPKLDLLSDAMVEVGFFPKGENGISGRRYFQKGGNQRSHHLHAFESSHPALNEHRAFREYLVAHNDIANQYAKVKRNAAALSKHNAELYMAFKHDFIQHHIKNALHWYRSQ